jgi:hypothetical protein
MGTHCAAQLDAYRGRGPRGLPFYGSKTQFLPALVQAARAPRLDDPREVCSAVVRHVEAHGLARGNVLRLEREDSVAADLAPALVRAAPAVSLDDRRTMRLALVRHIEAFVAVRGMDLPNVVADVPEPPALIGPAPAPALDHRGDVGRESLGAGGAGGDKHGRRGECERRQQAKAPHPTATAIPHARRINGTRQEEAEWKSLVSRV